MVTRAIPARTDAVRLLKDRFLNRTDHVAILAPWGKPCPVAATGVLDDLLIAHLAGADAPEAKVQYVNRRGMGAMKGHFRVGSYCPGHDDTTRWLCLDFDGAGHAKALADPESAALAACHAFSAAGLPTYLERSGGGKGWHLWCFFEPAVPAGKAQELGRVFAPKDALLADGSGKAADPRAGRGIEVFPKQQRIRRAGFGNLVWLPWWQGAAEGGNAFYRHTATALEPYVPTEFATASPELVERLLAIHAPAQPRSSKRPPRPPRVTPATATTADPAWSEWRRNALAALPLELVYGAWLTGKAAGPGWLECRDPSSPSGDQNPSASVADGAGDAERASFHSFISGLTVSVFDFLVEHGVASDFRAARARIAELSGTPEPTIPPPPPPDSAVPPGRPGRRRPKIVIRTAEHEVVDEAVTALAALDDIYCRGPILVHVVRDRSPLAGVIHSSDSMRIFPLGAAGVRDRLTAAAEWVSVREREGELEEVPAHPPTWAAPAVEARKSWPKIRYLEGVTESPVLRPDGTVLDRRGYDAATGLLYCPNARYPAVPAAPTQRDAERAIAELLEVVIDFPFRCSAHRAAWIAGVLTPLARYAFQGPAPLFLMDANIRGVGKTLLADVTGEIVCGRPMARTPQAADEGEEIKRITAIALDGTRAVLIDNINRPLGSGALDTVLTGTVWSERILGKSEKVNLPLFTVWYGSGNNVSFRGDTARRCLHIRLDSDLEKPEYREGFRHPHLSDWVRTNRPRLVIGALTVLRAYVLSGRPGLGLNSWGSFEGWSALVRNAVVWAGLTDPGETRNELEELDADSAVLSDLIAGWEELPRGLGGCGCTIAQALQILRDDTFERQYPRLRAALSELTPHPHGQLPTAKRVGYAMRRFRGRVAAERKLQTRLSAGNNLWFVQPVGADSPTRGGTLELPFAEPGGMNNAAP